MLGPDNLWPIFIAFCEKVKFLPKVADIYIGSHTFHLSPKKTPEPVQGFLL
jgi:hypothetical protein